MEIGQIVHTLYKNEPHLNLVTFNISNIKTDHHTTSYSMKYFRLEFHYPALDGTIFSTSFGIILKLEIL